VKDGGADASDGFTKATWTYTIKDLLNGDTLAEDKAPVKPREYGLAEYQTAETAVGMAFYDKDGVIQLWDAGEVIVTADPCDPPA
jgi:hypothetical protein